jgi:hypothetical protein
VESWVLPIVVAVVLIVIIVVGAWWLARGRSRAARGTAGVVRENTLVCPKCNGQFNYQFVPGASFTSLRLGRSRYMKCPLCGKWSVIKVVARPVAPADQALATKKGY